MVPESTSIFMCSSIVTLTPMRPSSSIIVVTSCKCGTLPMVTGPSASSVPARMGKVAFLAPEMRISPESGMPPVICSLSTRTSHFVGGIGFKRQGVDFPAHARAQRGVDELVSGNATFAGEFRGDDHGLEMHIVIALHADVGL